MGEPLLQLSDVRVSVNRGESTIPILRGVGFSVEPGEAIGMVGESGSGKSMTARAIMRLLPAGGRLNGEVRFRGSSIYEMDQKELREFRVNDVAMINQDPRSHINPVRRIGDYLTEVELRVNGTPRQASNESAERALADLGVPEPAKRMRQYPHQLSGGLLQRVMIAASLLATPKLLIADEPTTGLDVTTQEEVVAILAEMRARPGDPLALIFITHDLDLAAAITDRLLVVYGGQVVEDGPTSLVAGSPGHPYTAGLLHSRPGNDRVGRLPTIPGHPQGAADVGPGCPFASRCPYAESRCSTEKPQLRPVNGRSVACHFAEDLAENLTEPAGSRS